MALDTGQDRRDEDGVEGVMCDSTQHPEHARIEDGVGRCCRVALILAVIALTLGAQFLGVLID